MPWYSWKIAELALNNNHSLTQIIAKIWSHLILSLCIVAYYFATYSFMLPLPRTCKLFWYTFTYIFYKYQSFLQHFEILYLIKHFLAYISNKKCNLAMKFIWLHVNWRIKHVKKKPMMGFHFSYIFYLIIFYLFVKIKIQS